MFPVQVGCHVEFQECFTDVSFVKERDATGKLSANLVRLHWSAPIVIAVILSANKPICHPNTHSQGHSSPSIKREMQTLVTSPQWPILVLGEFLYMCVYVYTPIYISLSSVNVLFQLPCFLYCVFVKDIQTHDLKCHEMILRAGNFCFP